MSGISCAVVLDAEGRLVASKGLPADRADEALERLLARARSSSSHTLSDRSDESNTSATVSTAPSAGGLVVSDLPLPEGGAAVVQEFDATQAWSRFTRAFLHDLRGPLNSQNLYLELLRNRLHQQNAMTPDVEKCLSRIQEQVGRMDGLCREFSALSTTADTDESRAGEDESDVDVLCRAAARFAGTVTKRKDLSLRFEGASGRLLAVESVKFGEALVVLLGGALDAPAESELVFSLNADEQGVRLILSGLPPNGERLVEAGLALLSNCGARVGFANGRAEAWFDARLARLVHDPQVPARS